MTQCSNGRADINITLILREYHPDSPGTCKTIACPWAKTPQASHSGWAAILVRPHVCMHCNMGAIGDESFVLSECLLKQAARVPHVHLFPPGCSTLQFTRHTDTHAELTCILAFLRA